MNRLIKAAIVALAVGTTAAPALAEAQDRAVEGQGVIGIGHPQADVLETGRRREKKIVHGAPFWCGPAGQKKKPGRPSGRHTG